MLVLTTDLKVMSLCGFDKYGQYGKRRAGVSAEASRAELVEMLEDGYLIPVNRDWQVQLSGDSDFARDASELIAQGFAKVINDQRPQQYLVKA
jgi:hypothetical protein